MNQERPRELVFENIPAADFITEDDDYEIADDMGGFLSEDEMNYVLNNYENNPDNVINLLKKKGIELRFGDRDIILTAENRYTINRDEQGLLAIHMSLEDSREFIEEKKTET